MNPPVSDVQNATMNPPSSAQCEQAPIAVQAIAKSANKRGNSLHESSGRFTSTDSEFKRSFFKWKLSRAAQQNKLGRNDGGWYTSLALEWDSLHWTGNAVIPSYGACRHWHLRDSALYAEAQREMSQREFTCGQQPGTPQSQHARVSVTNSLTLEPGESSNLKISSRIQTCEFLIHY